MEKQDHGELVQGVLSLDGFGVPQEDPEGYPGQVFEVFEGDLLGHGCEDVQDKVLLVSLKQGRFTFVTI